MLLTTIGSFELEHHSTLRVRVLVTYLTLRLQQYEPPRYVNTGGSLVVLLLKRKN